MPIKFVGQCKVCKLIKAEARSDKKTLMNRIYDSRRYSPGGESLTEIAKDYTDKFEYQSLYKHARYHQHIDAEKLADIKVKRAVKEGENEKIRQLASIGDIHQEVMDQGLEALRNGTMEVTLPTVLKAVKDKADIEAKEKDQTLDFMKAVSMFASGELRRDHEESGYIATETSDSILEG